MGQTLLAKKEVNKVSKARMCEVMLDIQMIVPTERPMGDAGGIRELCSSPFWTWKNQFYEPGKKQGTSQLKYK